MTMAGRKMADSGQYDYPRISRRRYAGYKARPLGPSAEDAERWRRFCDELGERIAAIRAEDAPLLCPTCGTTAPSVSKRKTCRNCHREFPISAFSRNRSNKDGRQFWCRWCMRPLNARLAKVRRARIAAGLAS